MFTRQWERFKSWKRTVNELMFISEVWKISLYISRKRKRERERGRDCLLSNLCNSPSILCDIHSAAKHVWQGLSQRAHFQWPLTLVCPDTYDEYLQDTEGRQAAMSGFYYVLQRLGTVSLIKQIILEGKATGKRRRAREGEEMRGTGGKGEKDFAAQLEGKKKKN